MSTIATKLVWSITPYGSSKQNLAEKIRILVQNNISALRFTYSTYSQNIIPEILAICGAEPQNFNPTFLLEFVGRRCIVCLSSPHMSLVDNSSVELCVEVDFEFCAQNKITDSSLPDLKLKVSSADQLSNLKVGSLLNISYGDVKLQVTNIEKESPTRLNLKCLVVEGGDVCSGIDVHSKDISRDLFPLLPEDEHTLKNHFFNQADYLIVSGIKSEDELMFLKKSILGESLKTSQRHPTVPITSGILQSDALLPPRFLLKVGSKRTFELLPRLLPLVDGVFLSRSELGLDEHPHTIAIVQKEIVEMCTRNAKVIIIASELMHSMRQNASPTRAEVSDIANAMEDGADALVLSHEVTNGPHCEGVAHVTQDVLEQAEQWKAKKWHPFQMGNTLSDDDVVIYGAMRIAEQADVSAIVCFTEGGYTAFKLSAMRTPTRIIAVTCNKRIARQLNLLRGVQSVILNSQLKTEALLTQVQTILMEQFQFKVGDKFVFVSLTRSSIAERNSNLFTLQEIE